MSLRRLCLSLAVLSPLLAVPAAADLVYPTHNEATLARSFALPVLGASQVLAPGQDSWRFALDWTNEYQAKQTPPAVLPSESLILDGETQHYTLAWQYGLIPNLDAGIELPLLYTNGGVLDGLIQNWHHFWGLPNGGREQAPKDRYLYQYTRNGQTLLNATNGGVGLGDIQLNAGWQAWGNLALRAMVKLPTGSQTKLTGGNPGGALWFDYNPYAGSRRWFGFVSAGASMNAESGVLNGLQQRLVGFAGTGLGFRLWPRFSVMGQVYGQTPFYHDSGLYPLTHYAMQVTFGPRYDFSRHTSLNFGFEEKLILGSTPDFGFHLSLLIR